MTSTTLSSPLTLPSGLTLPNRLLKSAMTEGLADAADGPTEAHARLYRAWAEGGTGLLVTGNVMVDHRFLERPGNVVIEGDRPTPALETWAHEGTRGGARLFVQVSHPGRQCTRVVSAEPVAPSAVPLRLGGLFARPRALTEDEILDIVARFARVATVVQRAGFSGVQVHAAHGYLVSQFLSPRVNRRDDRWGGPLEHRAADGADHLEQEPRAVGPSFPVAVKLNTSDFQKGAFSHEDACQVAAWVAEEGVDLLELSGGTYEHLRLLGADDPEKLREVGLAAGTARREAYFLEQAAAIRRAARVPLAVTGGFRLRSTMVDALAGGELDVVGLARPLVVAPDAARRLLAAELDELPRPEDALALGPGWLGPRSSNSTLRALNSQAQSAWFYQQILHLAAGEPQEPGLGARAALFRHLRREQRVARARTARARVSP